MKFMLVKEFFMNIKIDLLRNYVNDFILCKLEDFEIDADKIADTTAIKALAEIQSIVQNEKYSDFDALEEIVTIFEKYHLDFGARHDF